MDWTKQWVAVFGGGGFLGRNIVNRLIALNCAEIKSFGRKPQPQLEKNGVKVIYGDLRDPECVNSVCENCDIIFHTAAKAGFWGSWKEYYGINFTGTENVVNACRKHGVRSLVYTSSPSVAYPPTLNIENMNESSPYPETFLAHYPHSKALAEQLVMRANDAILSTVSLRPHLIWGPEDPHLLPRLIQKGRMGKLIQVGAADNLVDLTYVENAAYAHILAAENLNGNGNAAGKTYFISDEAPVNIWKWLYELFEKLDIPPVKKSISYRQAYCLGAVMEKLFLLLPGEPPMTRFVAGQLAFSHYFNISAAKKDLGYQPAVTPEEAMEKTIAYFSSASLGFKN